MSYFSNKTIWITGASSGIGEALAIRLSKENSVLILSARRKIELERVRNLCTHPEKVHIVTFDQSNDESVRHAVNQCFDITDRLDILFNNGGISQRAEALKTSTDLERRIFDINFFGNILLSKLVAEKMIESGGGHLVITSSLLGKWGFHLRSSYAATKHALHGYYESMRFENENKGLAISLVMPGFIATDISIHAVDEHGKPTGQMDANQAKGISPAECADQILRGVSKKKREFGVGGSELFALTLRRFFPGFFHRMLRKRSAR